VYWNTEAISKSMRTWADVWDTKTFPGKRGFLDNGEWVLEQAALAGGASPDSLYPLDLDAVFSMLDRIKDDAAFVEINTLSNLVAQGDVVTGDLNLSRVQSSIEAGTPLKYVWDQAITDIDRLQIPKGAKNKENALKLLDFVMKPEQQLAVHEALAFSPATKAAFAKIPQDEVADMAASPVTSDQAVFLDVAWWSEHGDDAKKRFQEWVIA
jgi:putative spermidine/putrescine transport system substrate-binding protein